MSIDYSLLETSLAVIQSRWPTVKPVLGMILGSGWSDVAKAFKLQGEISFSEIPALGKAGVEGHAGTLSLLDVAGKDVLVFQGRRHYYEGIGWTPISAPVYLLKKLGAQTLIISNASGGCGKGLKPGMLVAIRDHFHMLGINPLIGDHNPIWGERFPDMSWVYDPELRKLLIGIGKELGEEIPEGVMCMSSGPTYETPAQVKMLQTLGADLLGMSTVPEATLAYAAGMKVVGIACVTNYAAGISDHKLSHKEVIETTAQAMSRMQRLIVEFVKRVVG